jgi:hypothetical protein
MRRAAEELPELVAVGQSLGVMPWVLRVCAYRVLAAVEVTGAAATLVATPRGLESALAGRLALYLGGPLGRRSAAALAAAFEADPSLVTRLLARSPAAEVAAGGAVEPLPEGAR